MSSPPHDATSDSGRHASLPPPAAPPRGPSVGGKRRTRRGRWDRHRPPPCRDRDRDDYPDDDDDDDEDDTVIFIPAMPLSAIAEAVGGRTFVPPLHSPSSPLDDDGGGGGETPTQRR